MSEVMIPIKGGGGTSSDDITASKSNVLQGKTTVTSDSDDEIVEGTMPNCGAKTAELACGESYPIPEGYHDGNGKVTAKSLASQTSANAGAGDILTGKTAYVNGGKVTGTMANQGAKTASLNCGGSYTIPAGYHNGSGKVTANSLSSQTSATAAAGNIISGKTAWVNGSKITGTLAPQSAISFSAAAISYNTIRISWKNPAKGPWQGVFIQISTSGYPGTGGGSRAYTGSGWANQSVANGSNYVDITGLNPSTTYYFTCTSYCDALGWGSSYNVSATTSAITVEAILSGKWSTSSSMTAELISGSKYYMYNKYLEKISGNHIYTTNNQHYARGSSYSSPNFSYFTLYDLLGVTQTQVDQLNQYFNRMSTYMNTASAYNDTVFKSGVTVSFSLVSSTEIKVNIGTKGPFYINGPQHVYFYKA